MECSAYSFVHVGGRSRGLNIHLLSLIQKIALEPRRLAQLYRIFQPRLVLDIAGIRLLRVNRCPFDDGVREGLFDVPIAEGGVPTQNGDSPKVVSKKCPLT